MAELYPFLTGYTQNIPIDVFKNYVMNRIDDSDMFASSFELDVVTNALKVEADIRLLVFIEGEDTTDSADKWLRELDWSMWTTFIISL